MKYRDTIKIITLDELNPEPKKHYDYFAHNKPPGIPRNPDKVEKKSYAEGLQSILNMESKFTPELKEFYQMLNEQLKIKRIYSVEAFHGFEAYGGVIESDDWRIFYTGDTIPNQNNFNYGEGTTLGIHEATFEDMLLAEAAKRYHSTVSQAIDSGIKMSAWRTCLTHYSQRYAEGPIITPKHFQNHVMAATDHLRLKLSDFEWAYKTLDIYKSVFDHSNKD